MENPNIFYTYAYLREDGTPYYIGKGKNNRCYRKYRRTILPPKDKTRIIFLKQNLTEDEAFKHEIYMIAVLGRKDLGTGILRNKTDGGDGASGLIHSIKTKKRMSESRKGEKNHNYGKIFSVETREKMSEARKGKLPSEETRRKLSEANKGENHPNYGKSLSEETRKKISELHKGKNVSIKSIEKFRNNFKKTYYLVSPIGEIIEEYDTFCGICKKYDLDVGALSRVKNGKQKQHKGWTFLKEDDKIGEQSN